MITQKRSGFGNTGKAQLKKAEDDSQLPMRRDEKRGGRAPGRGGNGVSQEIPGMPGRRVRERAPCPFSFAFWRRSRKDRKARNSHEHSGSRLFLPPCTATSAARITEPWGAGAASTRRSLSQLVLKGTLITDMATAYFTEIRIIKPLVREGECDPSLCAAALTSKDLTSPQAMR